MPHDSDEGFFTMKKYRRALSFNASPSYLVHSESSIENWRNSASCEDLNLGIAQTGSLADLDFWTADVVYRNIDTEPPNTKVWSGFLATLHISYTRSKRVERFLSTTTADDLQP